MSSETLARRLLQEAEERAARAECAARATHVAANEALHAVLRDPKLWASMYDSAHTAAVEAQEAADEARDIEDLEDNALEEAFSEFCEATYATYRLLGWPPEEAMDRVLRAAERGTRDEGLAAIRAAWAVAPMP
jgi:hypothetical protein